MGKLKKREQSVEHPGTQENCSALLDVWSGSSGPRERGLNTHTHTHTGFGIGDHNVPFRVRPVSTTIFTQAYALVQPFPRPRGSNPSTGQGGLCLYPGRGVGKKGGKVRQVCFHSCLPRAECVCNPFRMMFSTIRARLFGTMLCCETLVQNASPSLWVGKNGTTFPSHACRGGVVKV